jgi:hypothetical protein
MIVVFVSAKECSGACELPYTCRIYDRLLALESLFDTSAPANRHIQDFLYEFSRKRE